MESVFLSISVLLGVFTLITCQSLPPNVEIFGNNCYTPNQERGYCVYINDCTNLRDLVQRQTTTQLTYQELLFLRNSQCGYNYGRVLVCCTAKALSASSSPATTAAPVTSPPPRAGTGSNLLPRTSQCASTSDRIYGGTATELGEFPFMALIEYTKSDGRKSFSCGGSLISNRYVLTAAHCVKGTSIPQDWTLSGVRLGEWDKTTDIDCVKDSNNYEECADAHIDINVEKSITHEGYDRHSIHQYDDIALLRLSRNVPYSKWIKPICLPISNKLRSSNFVNEGLDVAGWGKTESAKSSSKKLKAFVRSVDLNYCNKIYSGNNVVLNSNQMCAGGEKDIDSCNGDSGGPLIKAERDYYFIAGIVSFGPQQCGLEGWPGVYTKVGPYIDWIEQNLE